MPGYLHIRKCAIEFRVKAGELDKAVSYYEDLFGASRKKTYDGLVVLEVEDDLMAAGDKWFYVSVREMAKDSPVAGPVVYWLTKSNTSEVYKEILNGREPGPQDEPPVQGADGSNRGSAIDAYGNRLGVTNPDYPPLAPTK